MKTTEYILQVFRLPDTSAGEYPSSDRDWYDSIAVTDAAWVDEWKKSEACEDCRIVKRTTEEEVLFPTATE